MTQAEILMWDKLKNNQFKGYKFRRQHPIYHFIVDFYCHALKLIIEIDGKYHESEEQKKEDLNRTELLQFQGLKEIRFSNEEVIHDMDLVLKKLGEDQLIGNSLSPMVNTQPQYPIPHQQ